MAIACGCAFNRILAPTLAAVICAALTVPATPAPSSDAEACYSASGAAAITACTRATASGAFDKSVLALLLVHRGHAWTSFKGQQDRSIVDYNQAIENDPRLAEAYHGRGNVYRSRGDLVRATADYDKAIGLDPTLVYAYIGRALAHRTNADIERAIADFDQAIRLKPGVAFVYFHRGSAYQAKGGHRQAIADYDQAIRRNPKLGAAYVNRGLAYLTLGQFPMALADYNAALKLDPRQAHSLYGRGVARLNQGDVAGGNADLLAARAIKASIAEEFARAGISVNQTTAPQPAPVAPVPIASVPVANCTAAETHWKSVEEIKTVAVYQDHLTRFPNCEFATLATARIQALKK